MQLERMTSMEVDAFFNYARALYEGKVDLPEGMTVLGEALEDVLAKMIDLYAVLRVTDYNTVEAVRQTMAVVNPNFLAAALEHQPPQKYLM